MKILQIVCYFYPSFAYGGTSRYVYELSKAMTKLGHQITVYTTDTLDRKKRIQAKHEIYDGIEIQRFPNVSNYVAYNHRIFITPSMIKAVKNNLKEYDVVHLHDYRTLQNLLVYHYARQYDIPYVLQAHGSLVNIISKQKLKSMFDIFGGRQIVKDASRLVAFTPSEAQQYKEYGVDDSKIDIIPNGVNLEEFNESLVRGGFRKKHGLKDKQKIVLFLGRINKIKGLDLLINSFADVVKEQDDVCLIITGEDDGYLAETKTLVAELKLEKKVIFTGALYGEDKLSIYTDADVYVLPSLYETFPTTVLEAMSCGIPIVITSQCGIADIIRGKAGLVVKPEKEQLAQAICRLLADANLRQRFSKNGKGLVKEIYNWDNIAEQMEKVYQKVI